MKLEKQSLDILKKALDKMEEGFSNLPEVDYQYDYAAIEEAVLETAERMKDNYPYFHPFYCGQMLKPPHPAARTAYMLSMWLNPNNHALDGGRASSQMEKEAVAEIARMFGWGTHLGHLCGGGTMANLEALWIAGKLNPDKLIIASEMAHYTHSRISEVLKLKFKPIPANSKGQMDINALEEILKTEEAGTVVATIATTGTGSVDPLPEIMKLKEKYGFRVHADAAYGGYFTLLDNLPPGARATYDELKMVDSIVVDPHKHGLQPYGCGCIIFRDPSVGKYYKHDSPYTYFSSNELHLGEISLECSRPGAAAVGLWTTLKLLPMVKGGQFAADLSRCREAALDMAEIIKADNRLRLLMEPETDIVTWAPAAQTGREISRLSQEIFEKAAENNLHLATFKFPSSLLRDQWTGVKFEDEYTLCLRCCLMKPEHKEWMDNIWGIIDLVTGEVTGNK